MNAADRFPKTCAMIEAAVREFFARNRPVFMVPINDTRYVPGDTVYKLVPPFYVGNAPSRWE